MGAKVEIIIDKTAPINITFEDEEEIYVPTLIWCLSRMLKPHTGYSLKFLKEGVEE